MSTSQTILKNLKVGLGAVRVDNAVSKIALTYPVRNGYSPGARYFYKDYLPRIKYNNPQVTFNVSRKSENVEAKVEVQFVDGKTKSLLIDRLSSHDICYKLLELTLPKDKGL